MLLITPLKPALGKEELGLTGAASSELCRPVRHLITTGSDQRGAQAIAQASQLNSDNSIEALAFFFFFFFNIFFILASTFSHTVTAVLPIKSHNIF